MRDYTNRVSGVAAIVHQREQDPWWFDQKLDSEDGGERSERDLLEGTSETHLRVGRAWAIHGVKVQEGARRFLGADPWPKA